MVFWSAPAIFASVSVTPSDSIKITLGQIPHVLHDQFPGPHNELIDVLVKKAAGQKSQIISLPYYRATRNFRARKTDCLYVAIDQPATYKNTEHPIYYPLFSTPVNHITLRAITRSTDPIVHSYADLSGKVIIGVRTQLEDLKSTLQKHSITVIYAVDHKKAFSQLDHQRAHAVITFGMDANILMKTQQAEDPEAQNAGVARYQYDTAFALSTMAEIMACWPTPATSAFIGRFNATVEILKKTGYLEKLFPENR